MSDPDNHPIKVFVFGTLRKGGRLDYYMDGGIYAGMYYTEGQLMMSEIGSAYIDFEQKGVATYGELYYMNLSGLLRINHLESRSGEFPKGYDLELAPIWKFNNKPPVFDESEKSYAFYYRRRNEPVKINSGDWIKRKKPVKEIKNFLNGHIGQKSDPEELISYMLKYLKK
jgi:gamma-glutamylcyclotransferase (GGCT)/AIG2-like uncharacterized protein YtfP